MEPWLAKLESGDAVGAWDAFLERYRRLMLATLRHYVPEPDLMDVFAEVCAELRENDLARPRRFVREQSRGARLSTWLVTVVRHRAIDFLRHRDGRPRIGAAVAALPPLHQKIVEYVFRGGCSHVEAYERLRSFDGATLGFAEFLRELAATYRALEDSRGGRALRELLGPPWPEPAPEAAERDASDAPEILAQALRILPPDVRTAVLLFVVNDVPAVQVARTVGWPNAKAVYNRVYRALADVRIALERQGIGRGDL